MDRQKLSIDELRRQIDEADGKLVELFTERMKISSEIARYKKENGMKVLDAQREKNLLDRVSEKAGDGLSDYVRCLYENILSLSREYQEKLIGSEIKPKASSLNVKLIGRSLAHSFSPQLHSLLADYTYQLKELEPEEVGKFIKDGDYGALNVTVPYKKAVIPFLSELSDVAERIGAVNTVTRTAGGLRGDNTDYGGFLYMLRRSGVCVAGKKVLVLGSGGASVTVNAVLRDCGAGEIITVSRSGENNYQNISRHFDAQVIVNTTPVGMFPEVGFSAVYLDDFKSCSGVLDLIYNPTRTKLLCDAERLSIPFSNGLPMLAAQAKSSCELFLGEKIEDDIIEQLIEKISSQNENIVLVGMPGCGKSVAGKALAKCIGREIVDTDCVVEKKAGMTVPEIFEKLGEEKFRQLEHDAICECGKMSGIVIATGGGAVISEDNYLPLHQNGTIVFLNRELKKLPRDGRPVSLSNSIEKLFEERKTKYLIFSDCEAECDDDFNVTVKNIIDAVKWSRGGTNK